jgi:hypothetical protein
MTHVLQNGPSGPLGGARRRKGSDSSGKIQVFCSFNTITDFFLLIFSATVPRSDGDEFLGKAAARKFCLTQPESELKSPGVYSRLLQQISIRKHGHSHQAAVGRRRASHQNSEADGHAEIMGTEHDLPNPKIFLFLFVPLAGLGPGIGTEGRPTTGCPEILSLPPRSCSNHQHPDRSSP